MKKSIDEEVFQDSVWTGEKKDAAAASEVSPRKIVEEVRERTPAVHVPVPGHSPGTAGKTTSARASGTCLTNNNNIRLQSIIALTTLRRKKKSTEHHQEEVGDDEREKE